MSLPSELIELVVKNLRNEEQYKCLIVNKSWYEATHRALYKEIRISSRYQLKLLFLNLNMFRQNGLLLRRLYLKKHKSVVGITTQELNDLASWCPFLESIDFVSSIWKYIQYPKNLLNQQMKKLPMININTPLASFYSAQALHRIQELNLHGELVSKLFTNQNSMLIQLLENTPNLKSLSLNSHQHKSHVIPFSLHDLETIHHTSPLLNSLELSGSFQFTINPTEDLIISPTHHLHHLKLKAIIPPSLVLYIAQKYPHLQYLDLEFLIHYTSYTTKHDVLCVLLECCPKLIEIEIDSHAAKQLMTTEFFKKQQLDQIKMKNLPYHLITRDQPFFDTLMRYGQHVVTGLGIEIMDSLGSIINPLSCFTRLTELVLCCGQPYFDCPLDTVLESCRKLTVLTIRSAHVLIKKDQLSQQQQHPLKSLHLSTVSFSFGVFQYLGKSCHGLNQLSFYECDQRNEKNRIDIDMPCNDFECIVMNGIRLNNVPLESHAWIPNARILSIETETKKKRWYHVYNSNVCFPQHPKLQRLNQRKSAIAEHYYQYGWINNKKHLQKAISLKQKQETQHYLYTRSSKEWEQDLCFGQISIRCKSIKQWELICNTTFNEF